MDADYSQIELRVLAHVADDADHEGGLSGGPRTSTPLTAAQRVPNARWTWSPTDMRSKAKAVNFGIVYGIGAFSLSKDIGVTRKEADDYIKELPAQLRRRGRAI